MLMDVTCESCGQSRPVSSALAGRRVRCLACGHEQRIAERAPDLDRSPTGPDVPDVVPSRASSNANRATPDPRRGRFNIFEESRLQALALLLVVASIADIFATYLLLRTSPDFYESNPLAQWFFSRWNMAGMVVYKFALLIGVIALSEYIERHRPGWGRGVLLFGFVGASYAALKGLSMFLGFSSMAG